MDLMLDDKADAMIEGYANALLAEIRRIFPEVPQIGYANFEISRKSPAWENCPASRWLILSLRLLEPPYPSMERYCPTFLLNAGTTFEDFIGEITADIPQDAQRFKDLWPRWLKDAEKSHA